MKKPRPNRFTAFLLAGFLLASGCGENGGGVLEAENRYADASLWLCRPGLPHNYCSDDISATEIKPDGSAEVIPFVPAAETAFDCFYIYPTVDLAGPVGNHTDFSDVSPMLVPLRSQAARFSELCTVYAPLYRQITILTFASSRKNDYLEVAYEDVALAFQYYLENSDPDRPFVLLGHSQGAMMLRMLLQREFDPDPALRARLIAALPIGGDVVVAPGETAGGSFSNLPLCTAETETGCVLAYRSYAADYPPAGQFGSVEIGAGNALACTNPADLSGEQARLAGAYLPTVINYSGIELTLIPGIATPFAVYRDFFTARCAATAEGSNYLEIGVEPGPDDARENPIPFDSVVFDPSLLGLHLLDYDFTLGDLLRLVRIKAEGFRSSGSSRER